MITNSNNNHRKTPFIERAQLIYELFLWFDVFYLSVYILIHFVLRELIHYTITCISML